MFFRSRHVRHFVLTAVVVISIVTVSVKGGWIFGLTVILLIVGIWQPVC